MCMAPFMQDFTPREPIHYAGYWAALKHTCCVECGSIINWIQEGEHHIAVCCDIMYAALPETVTIYTQRPL